MPITEAQKRATYAYRLRIKNTDTGEQMRLKQIEYSKKYSLNKYHTDEEFRLNKIVIGCDRNYYNEDQILRCIRKLFN